MSVVPAQSAFLKLRGMLRPAKTELVPGMIGTFMARDALSLAAAYLKLTPNDVVLLPAYLCKEVWRPFAGHSQLAFYDVDNSLNVDPSVIQRLLKAKPIRMLLIINYFGFLQPWRAEIATLCEHHGTVLLEDCAHSLLTQGSGETGELCVVSFRKMLPVVDGGGLTIRRTGEGSIAPFHPQLYSNLLSLLALAKSLTRLRTNALSRAGMADRRQALSVGETRDEHRKVLPLSWFARNGACNASVVDIIERRRRDYQFWHAVVSGVPTMTPTMESLGDGVCPLGFPVIVQHRDSAKAELEKLRVPVTMQWTLARDLGGECTNSHRLSRQMMTLPVYPELTARTRERVSGAVRGGLLERMTAARCH